MNVINKTLTNTQKGVSLLETLVAMAIIGFVAAVFLGGMFTSIKGNEMTRTRISAESLARNELEYVKSSSYCACDVDCWSYSLPGVPPAWDAAHTDLPAGYQDFSIFVAASRMSGYNDDIQKITATVFYKGNMVTSIETYRTK